MMTASVRIPVLHGGDDEVAYEPTQRAHVSFGQWTMPLRAGTRPFEPIGGLSTPATQPLMISAVPRKPTRTGETELPAPLIAPPPSASRAIALGSAIGMTLGVALLALAWRFLI